MAPVVSILSTALSFAASAAAAARTHALSGVPNGWSKVSEPQPSSSIVLTIGLKPSNATLLEKTLYALSSPGSPEYGKWLSKSQVDALFAPSKHSNDAVLGWLKEHGISGHSDGGFIDFATDVATANKLLSASYAHYESASGVTKLRTTKFTVPESVADYIGVISPTTFFGKTTAQRPVDEPVEYRSSNVERTDLEEKRWSSGHGHGGSGHGGGYGGKGSAPTGQAPTPTGIAPSCETSVTPQCEYEFYNIGGGKGYKAQVPYGANRVAFASFLNESARYEDLRLFDEKFGIPYKQFDVITINGGVNRQTPDPVSVNSTNQIQLDDTNAEANGDAQLISGIIRNQLPITEYITAGSPPFVPNLDLPTPADNTNEPYLEYYRYLLSQENEDLPQVISASYGDDEQTVPPDYADTICFLIGQVGLRGISLLGSSGDNGLGAPCQSNDGKKTPQFTPQFPSTCPWFTAVGGTQGATPEISWLGTGAGFSNYFSRPAYQESAVESYLPKVDDYSYYAQFANFSGRAFPDISAHSADPRIVYFQDNLLWKRGFAGTSAASPLLAGVIALLNDVRLSHGKPTLGFLNPFLYKVGYKGLVDITLGHVVGCYGKSYQAGNATVEGASIIPGVSFNATKGWDPATGLGIPDFDLLSKIVLDV